MMMTVVDAVRWRVDEEMARRKLRGPVEQVDGVRLEDGSGGVALHIYLANDQQFMVVADQPGPVDARALAAEVFSRLCERQVAN